MLPTDFGSIVVAVLVLVGSLLCIANHKWTPPPEVGVLILGALAFLVPTLAEPMSPREKAIWSGVFFVVAYVEIVAIKRDRQKQREQFERIQGRFTELQTVIVAEMRTRVRLDAATAAHVPEASLKRRGLTLSDEILRFLLDRQRDAVPLPRMGTWEQDAGAMIAYSEGTMALYSQRFGARVIAMRNELADAGLTDPELDQFYEHPTNPIGIRIVAERLGALAERLNGKSIQDISLRP